MRIFMKKIKTFLLLSFDANSKEFLIFLCIDFSFLINGVLTLFISTLPTIYHGETQNIYRIYLGTCLIAIWFVLLPFLDRKEKDKTAFHIIHSIIALFCLVLIIQHWVFTFDRINFEFRDIIITLISIPTIAYLLYCFINLVKLLFWTIQIILHKILPELPNEGEKRGLIFTLESITSLFIAISSFIGAFCGIITAIKLMFS